MSLISDSHRKKRRKIDVNQSISNQFNQWRTSSQQQSYSSNLITALRHVRRHSSTVAVRAAADKALAISAKGRTRWSRAILTNRRKLRLKKHKKSQTRSRFTPPPPRPPPQTAAVTATEKRVKVLGRLVPGCRKLSLPNLLEETSDYIAALQMQIRAMAALTQILSGSTSSNFIQVEPDSNGNNPVR